MILDIPNRDVLRSIINLQSNGNFQAVQKWLSQELDESGFKISVSNESFSLTKGAGAVMLLAELVRILSEAEELIGLSPETQEEQNEK